MDRQNLSKPDRYAFDRAANIRQLLTLLTIKYCFAEDENEKELIELKITQFFGSSHNFLQAAEAISQISRPESRNKAYLHKVKLYIPQMNITESQHMQMTHQNRLICMCKRYGIQI